MGRKRQGPRPRPRQRSQFPPASLETSPVAAPVEAVVLLAETETETDAAQVRFQPHAEDLPTLATDRRDYRHDDRRDSDRRRRDDRDYDDSRSRPRNDDDRDAQRPPRSPPRERDNPPPKREPPRTESGRVNLDPDAPDEPNEEDVDMDDDAGMMSMMGMSGFGSTKGKHIEGNQEGSVSVKKQRTWRQYMNRRGGFNRPLDKIK
ncbi:hypothetical protein FB45DRAFT_912577 [Roridomyces roridus]|uniref:U4/U6.U5 small nuclear ribonucleoprotein 27kDa protein domain-containing protein n=1 Tax=Roridomyces roridus TaxID=1738132 RepID=A0AAD7BW79_9AGAR|nr:hypothetical protein FB45DRAFT_912577 [Roridomyces roridus]